MKSTFILVADSTRARFFTTESSSSPLHEIETFNNPGGRLHEQDITTDLPGKVNGHAYESETSVREHMMTDFARRIAKHLEDARVAHKFKQLFVVAAPGFLGKLRAQFTSPLNNLVCFELAKNLTTHSNSEIRGHLPEHLAGLSEPR